MIQSDDELETDYKTSDDEYATSEDEYTLPTSQLFECFWVVGMIHCADSTELHYFEPTLSIRIFSDQTI